MLCYKLLKKIFITGLLIVATVSHDYRKGYIRCNQVENNESKTRIFNVVQGSGDSAHAPNRYL